MPTAALEQLTYLIPARNASKVELQRQERRYANGRPGSKSYSSEPLGVGIP